MTARATYWDTAARIASLATAARAEGISAAAYIRRAVRHAVAQAPRPTRTGQPANGGGS